MRWYSLLFQPVLLLNLKQFAWEAGLADDRLQRAAPDLFVIGHRYCDRSLAEPALHHDVAAAPADFAEAIRFEYSAKLTRRKDTQSRQRLRSLG